VIKKEADEENKEKEPMAKGGKDDAPEKGDEGGDGKGEVAVGQQPIQQKVSSDSIAPYRASPAPACFGRRGGRGRGGGGRQKVLIFNF
jgi:hypothetical protein